MVDGVEIKLRGLKETQTALYSYSQQLGDKVVLSALMQGAKVFVRQARLNAPVRTGRLRKAIYVAKSKIYSPKRGSSKIGVYVSVRPGKKRTDLRGAYYAGMVENGYTTRGKKINKTVGERVFDRVVGAGRSSKYARGARRINGRHYMRNAFYSRRNTAVDVAVASIIAGAEVVKRKVGLR